MARYVIADPEEGSNWEHMFLEENDEGRMREVTRETRFVYDLEAKDIVHFDVQRGWGWQAASPDETAELKNSLEVANDDALVDPEEWGLDVSDELPEWAKPAAAPEP
ncbi:hypothetical protein LAZ40_04255 [Cereibacter sphaeroides]|uniref:hypothetical protein n=1 Tax=Cereibacter sphaeroides TaxID=1063 RepID=UPI001F17281F|nr:hypothetical protein [Cereibacter sphaeroides]MCE6958267.1 hypothetical protein [Cereibacter sphaeroides]MCE6971330.1 hypothetical protein [Cereibacter sphaeroides]